MCVRVYLKERDPIAGEFLAHGAYTAEAAAVG